MAQEEKKQKTFRLKLQGAARWVSQLSYEKNDKDLILHITLSGGNVSADDIVFQDGDEDPSDIVTKLLPKIEFLPSFNSYVLWLQKSDLDDLGMQTKQLPKLCEQLESRLGEGLGYLVFAPSDGPSHQAILKGGSYNLRSHIKSRFAGQEKGEWMLFSVSGDSKGGIINKLTT